MPTRSAAEAIERSVDGSIARTLNRKSSLLRIVPTACGQAAGESIDLAAPAIFIRRATRLPMLGDCASIATLCHDRLSERSYLFTMSDIAHAVSSRMARWRFAHDVLLRTSQSSVGGARRNRTDDLLLAKQALSQLSYGPSRYTEASIGEERARLITDT